ncbi:L-arabinose transporter ATP-binding protein [Sphingomonas sp. MM-1]|uniref:L-arabinose ABC transporter ATP-binding protein AraG n=1 Tax=Sphingomonas sp. MM-1 TaxID=745310 RepID=UPI0002C0EF1B|nr:L-arabinose ABC transporter ATP-binding protein AraG [Sphingomonas sp. MM-1]AGH49664.1 L-arabinose transporter ATP-binding protein [Sphingomonas sp. MM-1]
MSGDILLAYEGVGKRFPGVVALDAVSFSVRAGEVRALMGENGAGKSTLLKILAGEHRPDSGAIAIGGEDRIFVSPRDSQAAGIAIIHQELHLAPDMSVAENLLLGTFPACAGFIRRGAMRARAAGILARLGEDIDPDARLGDLSIGKRQMVEIGKALLRDARIIAFDEPTSSLSARETETLKRIIGELRADGRAILYVSHRMEEVFALADSVTVLRDGRHVADYLDMTRLTQDQLIAAMAGRTIADIYDYRPRPLGDVHVEIDGIEGPGLSAPITLSIRRGEILGMFGLVGAGRSELLKLIYGAERPTAGSIRLDGGRLDTSSPRRAIAAGFALCPEDRKGEGIVPLAAVAENIAIARRNLADRRAPFIDRPAETREAGEMIGLMRVKTASPATAIATLSGGNQQKAIIARWLAADARILLMDEPTRGIDVGARSEIYAHIYRLAEAGRTILFASSDMPEVMGIADRIVVMRDGAISGVLARAEATAERLLRLALPDAAPR